MEKIERMKELLYVKKFLLLTIELTHKPKIETLYFINPRQSFLQMEEGEISEERSWSRNGVFGVRFIFWRERMIKIGRE